ncbi:hypothetical protein V1477_019460 [Vespula maculifrons]|uniref:Uncharacterized protein n=1 Tax=Vespula maculifrons TaxID=7453 RepID=A0ABD2ASN0_VESMC
MFAGSFSHFRFYAFYAVPDHNLKILDKSGTIRSKFGWFQSGCFWVLLLAPLHGLICKFRIDPTEFGQNSGTCRQVYYFRTSSGKFD